MSLRTDAWTDEHIAPEISASIDASAGLSVLLNELMSGDSLGHLDPCCFTEVLIGLSDSG